MIRRVKSLAEVPPEQAVRVRRILFDCLRHQCDELGLHEGDRLSLWRRDGETVLVEGDGGPIRCPAELARFVEVEPDPN